MLKIKLFNHQKGDFQETVLTPEATPQRECLIGRAANCDLILDSFDISRTHGRIQFQAGEYYYTDLGSANGSRINNEQVQVKQNYRLKIDDLIRVGDFVLLIEAIETPTLREETSIWKKLNGEPKKWNQGDLTVRCVRITNETADVKTFTFVADPPVLFDYQPGQFVTLELEINGEQVLRSYSLSSTPSRPHTLEITVKRVSAPTDASDAPAGLVSNWLHDNLKIGDSVKLSGPTGKFTCLPNPAAKLLLISAGSGITPMMSMVRWLADTVSESDIVFFHTSRTYRDIIFRQELELMAARLPNFHLAISVTQSELGQPWLGLTGRLTEAMLHCIAPDFLERTVYVCGPNGFMQNLKTLLETLQFPMQNYHEESFGAPKKQTGTTNKEKQPIPSVPPASPASPAPAAAPSPVSIQPLVYFAQSKKELASDGTESILELAEQVEVKIRSSCKQGVCGACKKRKLEGTIRYESEPDALDGSEQEAGYILPCVAMPLDRVVIEA